jgi:capsular polysaccharide export protein
MLSDPDDVRHLCMVLEQDVPLAQAFETVDHVYTITSQAGFEALMRGIHVTTLGCPFYAGWGLTDERQPNPRRTRKLTVEQVLAGAYLLYPKYFDPLYKQPISSEQAIERLLALKQMAKPAMPVADEGVEEAAEMMAEQAASSEAEAAAEPSAAQLQAADIKEELLSLRLEIANLRYQLSQHALGNELPGLRADLKKLGLEMQQMRSVEAVA